MSAIVERHGGIVEKYIGDAIMAVFGVPIVHEDDALRAVRAAVEMRDTLATSTTSSSVWGVRLASRIGVNTGEVIAGDHSQGQLFVTGKAVNVAKRLEEAAATNEILIGEATHRLVRDAVMVEPSGAADRQARGGRPRHHVCTRCSRTRPAFAASTRPSSGASGSALRSERVRATRSAIGRATC